MPCPLMPGDRRCWVVTGALPALAALAPPHCDVRLLDENVEPLDIAALQHYDVIGVSGMVVQARRMHEILAALHVLPARIVVGGPYVSVAEAEFAGVGIGCCGGSAWSISLSGGGGTWPSGGKVSICSLSWRSARCIYTIIKSPRATWAYAQSL